MRPGTYEPPDDESKEGREERSEEKEKGKMSAAECQATRIKKKLKLTT